MSVTYDCSDEETIYSNSVGDEGKDNLMLDPWENLIQYLSVQHLSKLRNIFKNEIDLSNIELTKEKFVESIDFITGNSKYSLQASELFNQIVKSKESTITWPQFLDYFIENVITDESNDTRMTDPNILPIPHVKRESIIKIVPIETSTTFSYAIVSKYGKIGLYTGNLVILTSYKVIYSRCDLIFKNKSRNEKSIWITDAMFLPNICIFVVSNSARGMIFYDASKQNHVPLWLIEGMPNAIYSMEYYSNHSGTVCKLFLGEDFGSILILNFKQVKEGLFRRKFIDKLSCFYWRELADEIAFVQIEKLENVHSNIILSIQYNENTNTLISTSRDQNNSAVFYNTKDERKTYCFKCTEGISCVSISYKLHLFLSGNDSGTIYVWNVYVTSKPITILKGHKSPIIDLQILDCRNACLTCSSKGVLKLWDLKSYNCLQTISVKFPCFDILGKLIEWGKASIHPGPKSYVEIQKDIVENSVRPEEDSNDLKNPWKRSLILITCCNYIAKIHVINGSKGQIYDNNILPPPPVQNETIIPNDWNLRTDYYNLKDNERELKTEVDLKIEYHPILKSILKPDFFKNLQKLKYNINEKTAEMEIKKMNMIRPVLQCAAFVALDLHEIKEVKISTNLPIPRGKNSKKIYDRVQRLLSADSIRTEILSDRSSKSKSSKSSIIEFDMI